MVLLFVFHEYYIFRALRPWVDLLLLGGLSHQSKSDMNRSLYIFKVRAEKASGRIKDSVFFVLGILGVDVDVGWMYGGIQRFRLLRFCV